MSNTAGHGKLDEGHNGEPFFESEWTRSASGFAAAFELLKNMSGNERWRL